jgi:surface polysaccharide O-acyltransferase-like enzyme
VGDIPKEVLAERPALEFWPPLQKIGYFIITGAHLKPLWFVPMIAIFYVAAPLLIKLDRNQWLYRLLPLFALVSLFVDRQALSDIPRMFVHFFSVYTFGMFMSRYKAEISVFSSRWWLPLSLITVALCVVTSFDAPYYDKFMYIQKMFLCWFFIYWLDREDRFVPGFFDTLADMSFGIFFLHYYFLLFVKNIFEELAPVLMVGNAFTWVLHLTLILALNCIFIFLVRKVFNDRSRYLIGC